MTLSIRTEPSWFPNGFTVALDSRKALTREYRVTGSIVPSSVGRCVIQEQGLPCPRTEGYKPLVQQVCTVHPPQPRELTHCVRGGVQQVSFVKRPYSAPHGTGAEQAAQGHW